ncbi:MAG: hypothetical protein JWR80_6507 [Bradyrhizobium sp.]|nr:hypothetical protein [Bradyrhizobium sp.]
MGAIEFYGATPDYGEFYYNLHAETGRCVSQIDERLSAAVREPVLLISPEPILSRKVALAALKVRAGRSMSSRTNVVWLDVYSGTSSGAFWEAVLAGFIEIWLQIDAVETSYFERKLISSGTLEAEPRPGTPPPSLLRILDQMSGVEIVVVLDVRDASEETAGLIEAVVSGFEELLTAHTRNCIALLLLATPETGSHRALRRARRAGSIQVELAEHDRLELIELLRSGSVREAGYGQMDRSKHKAQASDDPAARTATSIALVGQPILASAVRYLADVADGGGEAITSLTAEGAVERLRNRGLALTNLGADKYGASKPTDELEFSRRLLEANGAHLLSALRPRDLLALDGSRKMLDLALDRRQSIVENVGACLAARVNQSSTLGSYLGDRLSGILRSRSIDWSPPDAHLLDEVLKYLSLVAFREPALFDRSLFKLTEELTYALNGFGAQADAAGSQYLRAQRITRLTHLYDQAPLEVRTRIGQVDTRRFARQALEILDADSRATEPSQEVLGTYLSGWLHQDLGDASAARKRLMEAARLSRLAGAEDESFGPMLRDTALSYDLAAQALFFSEDQISASETDLLLGMLRTHGIVTSVAELSELGNAKRTERKLLPQSISASQTRWHIVFDRRDIGVAIMIASAILFEWKRPIELVCVGDDDDVGSILARCGGERVVIGGPDSPGPIGDYLREAVADISRLWQLRFNESFFQPVILESDQGRTILLLTSIAGDGLRAWAKFILNHQPFQQQGHDMDPTIFGTLLPTILTTGSKKLTELFIDKVVKVVEGRLEPKARAEAGKELAVVKSVLEAATECGSAAQAQTRIEQSFKTAVQSKLVLTGFMDSTDNASLYVQLEDVMASLATVDSSTKHYRDMSALLRILSLAVENQAGGDFDRARKARAFADGFSNLCSRLDTLMEEYETKAEWNAEARNKIVNDLISTGSRFLVFARQGTA